MSDTSRSLVYRIDANNRITWVNAAWSEFARNNNGEAVMPAKVLGQDLFASIADPALRQIYRTIIERVRAGAAVSFSYCCHAPDKNRVFDMEVHLLPGRSSSRPSSTRRRVRRWRFWNRAGCAASN